MKKVLSLILAVALVASLGVSAFAVGSVIAEDTTEYGDQTSALPVIIDADENGEDALDDITATPYGERSALDDEDEADYEEAYATLEDAAGDYTVRYFFYVDGMKGTTVLTFRAADIKAGDDVAAKLYDGSAWVDQAAVAADGSIQVTATANGPLAILTK